MRWGFLSDLKTGGREGTQSGAASYRESVIPLISKGEDEHESCLESPTIAGLNFEL